MEGPVKAIAILAALISLSLVAYFMGLLGPIEGVVLSGSFTTESIGVLLSVGLVAGFVTSAVIVKAARRNVPESNDVERDVGSTDLET